MILLTKEKKYEFQTNQVINIYEKKKDGKYSSEGCRSEHKVFDKVKELIFKKYKGIKGFEFEFKNLKYTIEKTSYDYKLTRTNLKTGKGRDIAYYLSADALVYLIFRDIIGIANSECNFEEFKEFMQKLCKAIFSKGVVINV